MSLIFIGAGWLWAPPPAKASGEDAGLAADGSDIPLIDAHSQVDCHVSESKVLGQIKKLRIRRVLISTRGCKGWTPQEMEARLLKWAAQNPESISAHLSTKVGGWSRADLKESQIEAFLKRARRDGFVGMAEILVQHAAHDNPHLKYSTLSLPLNDRRIQAAIGVANANAWPVILHIELNDDAEKSDATLTGLDKLAGKHPGTNFILIHMGQSTPREARDLIEAHRNIYFLTTTADDFAAFSVDKRKRKGHVAQSGWINMFEGKCQLDKCPMRWKNEWQKLITAYPSRFVLAFDNVFPIHWDRPYEIKVGIWRRALAKLPREVALKVACSNAVRLWRLNTSCD